MSLLLSSIEFNNKVINSEVKNKKKRRNNIEESSESYQYILSLPQVKESDPFELIQQHLTMVSNNN